MVVAATLTFASLVSAWRGQTAARLTCMMVFDPHRQHNGYFQLNLLKPHESEELFEGEIFMYYPAYQQPRPSVRVVRSSSGNYGPSIVDLQLTPFSQGLASADPAPISLPTPTSSQRRFPFDTPRIDLRFAIEPALRPGGLIVRNFSPDFVMQCNAVEAKWFEPNELAVRVSLRRNPFVRTTIILMIVAAFLFAALLGLVRETDDLAIATASYFFSIWSIRGIVTPTALSYSTLLDLWLMGASILVLFVVGWRLSSSRAAA
jgi:hypothetical protein